MGQNWFQKQQYLYLLSSFIQDDCFYHKDSNKMSEVVNYHLDFYLFLEVQNYKKKDICFDFENISG